MEQIPVIQSVSQQPTLRGLMGLPGGQMMPGDAFAMIFQQMMDQGGQLNAAAGQMLADLQEDAGKMGAQMAAEMLLMMPEVQPQGILPLEEGQPVVQGAWGGMPFMGSAKVDASPLLAEEPLADSPAAAVEGEKFYTVLHSIGEETQQMPADLPLYGENLRAAKELLSQKEKDDVQPLDIESLQADVDAGRFLPVDLAAQKASLPDAAGIAAQLKSGILDNIAQGKKEFVVRLKPEGIGEIVVKLSENREKISLSIFTSSTETARMITNEVAALQNSLRPLHAEVQQVVVTPGGQAEGYAAQTAMANQDQQFHGQAFYGREQGGGMPGSQEDSGFGAEVQQILESDDSLDTYI